MRRPSELFVALLLVAASRIAVLAGAGALSLSGIERLATRWDAEHFIRIAERGYVNDADYAFAPLLPLLIRALMLAGLPGWLAGMIVAAAGSVALLLGMARLYGWRTAGLAMAFPTLALYTSVPYSEAVALPLLAWGLLEYERGHHARAGLLLGLSAAARYTMGLAGLALLVHALARGRRAGARLLLGLAGPALALMLFFASSPWGVTVYFRAERYWQAGTGTPVDQARWLLESPIVEQFTVLHGVPVPPAVYVARNALFDALAIAGLALAWKRWRRPCEIIVALPLLVVPMIVTGVPAISAPRLLLSALPSIAGLAPESAPTRIIYAAGATAGACTVAAWHASLFFG